MNTDQIRKMSVVEVTNTQSLQDARMGNMHGKCATCGMFPRKCIGHYGHIALPFPVFAPLLTKRATFILKNLCLNCLKLPIKKQEEVDIEKQFKAIKMTDLKGKHCPFCKKEIERFELETLVRGKFDTRIPMYFKCTKFQAYHIKSLLTGQTMTGMGSADVVKISPFILQTLLKQSYNQEEVREKFKYPRLYDCSFIEAVPIPPNSIRILSQENQSHAMNSVYTQIVNAVSSLNASDFSFVDDLFLPPMEKLMQQRYEKIVIGARVAMSADTSRNAKQQYKQILLEHLSIQTAQEPASAFAQCTTKKGWGRQHLSSVRVNMSARTVIVGEALLNINQMAVPQFFAESLFSPIYVSNINIDNVRALIANYPNYPCAVRRIYNGMTFHISEETKQLQFQQLQIGDIVMRQLVDGDVVMTNRYPTLREESFGLHTIKVENTKSIKFPLSVISKMNADFDGDEMQLFCLSSCPDMMEAINLLSMSRQFVTYETGLNVVGNKKISDLDPGIYHLKNESFQKKYFSDILGDDEGMISGIEIIQKLLEKLFESLPGALDKLNFNDGNTIIENGKIKTFTSGLGKLSSKFLSFLWFHFGGYIATSVVDNMVHLAYRVNMISTSSLSNDLFLPLKDLSKVQEQTTERLNTLQEKMDEYYNGEIIPITGFSKKQYFEKLFFDRIYDGQLIQSTYILDKLVKNNSTYLSDMYKNETDKIESALCQLGQQLDSNKRIEKDMYYDRTLICFPKFEKKPEYEGYVTGNYIKGLTQKEIYFCSVPARRTIFVKGNEQAISGYLARRLNQGSGNAYAQYNGIIIADGGMIISYQYGSGGYDPRCYVKIPFDKHKIPMEEFEKQYKSHPRYDEILQIRKDILASEQLAKQTNPYFSGYDVMNAPFIFDQLEVSEEDLDDLFYCRITKKMSDEFIEIITSQVYQFYIYCLFFLKINPKAKYNLVEKYIQSMVQSGDPIGMKAGLACSQPYSQSNLNSIHGKKTGMAIVQENRTKGCDRFKELVTGNSGPTVVQFKLIGNLKHSKEISDQFIQDYQTILFVELEPDVEVRRSTNRYQEFKTEMEEAVEDVEAFERTQISDFLIIIKILVNNLSYRNVNIEAMAQQIIDENPNVKGFIPFVKDEQLICMVYFAPEVQKTQVMILKNSLLDNYAIGSGIFENLYHAEDTIEGNSYKFIANIDIKKKGIFQRIHLIRGIDHETIYCSHPVLYEQANGIVRARQQLYMELFNNLSTDDATKQVQSTHVKIISDILTQTGVFGSFTRNQYKKEGARDVYSKFLFEQGGAFLEEEVNNPQIQLLDTMLNSCIFGTKAKLGTTLSGITFDKVLVQQDQKSLQDQMDEE